MLQINNKHIDAAAVEQPEKVRPHPAREVQSLKECFEKSSSSTASPHTHHNPFQQEKQQDVNILQALVI